MSGSNLLQSLAGLADQSLVRQEGEDERRFLILETIREYAQERLELSGERDEVRRRHAEWYLALAEEALDDEPFARAWEEGRATTAEQAIACALEGVPAEGSTLQIAPVSSRGADGG